VQTVSHRWFWFGCLLESSLGLAALLVGIWLEVKWGDLLAWSWRTIFEGLACCLPLLGFYGWAMQTEFRAFAEVRELLTRRFLPLMHGWSWLHIAAISAVAGFCEECLFRGSLQMGLGAALGQPGALIFASVAFGLCHALTPTYAIAATLIGIFLGWESRATGGLGAPIITHAVYDFVALLYLQRWHRSPRVGL